MNNNMTRREFIKAMVALAGLGETSLLSGCGNKQEKVFINPEEEIYDLVFTDESLDKFASFYDDVLPLADGIDVTAYHPSAVTPLIEIKDFNLVDAMIRAEKSIKLNHLFKEHGMGVKKEPLEKLGTQLTPAQEYNAIDLSYEEVEYLLEIKSDIATDDETNQILHYIRDYHYYWHIRNNAKIFSSLLIQLLKSYVYQVCQVEELDQIIITPHNTIEIHDKNTDDIIKILNISSDENDILGACYKSIIDCQTPPYMNGRYVGEWYDKNVETALKNLKRGVACGAKLDGDTIKQEKIVEEVIPEELIVK